MKTISLLYQTRGLVWTLVAGSFGYLLWRFRYATAITVAFLALLALPLVAEAGSNIKQKDTGATVWENQDGEQVPVGNPGLTVLLEDVSTASTAYVVTHKAGNIVEIYSTLFAAITTADATLDFGRVESDGGVYQSISSASTSNDPQGGVITITGIGSSAGDVDSVTFTVGTDPALGVSQGQTIWIHTDGSSTTDADAVITIIIE